MPVKGQSRDQATLFPERLDEQKEATSIEVASHFLHGPVRGLAGQGRGVPEAAVSIGGADRRPKRIVGNPLRIQ